VCRLSPPPQTAAVAVVEELQEQLLAREEELTRRMEALAAWEKSIGVSERALVKVSQDLDME
jgi:predicted dithiol-disulfide oxidoreductase (DUF899 family)